VTTDDAVVRAAGALPWRREDGELQVMLVHRPRYDDWSWPKGKLDPGEQWPAAAVREVLEETGLEVDVESDLGDIRYFYVWEGVRVRKRVHFFLMRMTGGDVEDHDTEMEDVRWFPLRSAVKRAAYRGEREVIERAVERLA